MADAPPPAMTPIRIDQAIASAQLLDLPLDDIAADLRIWCRSKLDRCHLIKIMGLLQNGVPLPHPLVFFDLPNYWLVDGQYRREAHKRLNRPTMRCWVYPGTREQAMVAAANANFFGGAPRKPADKRLAVFNALTQLWEWGDMALAHWCGCSPFLVAQCRRRVQGKGSPTVTRKCHRSGKVLEMDVRRIGAHRSLYPDLQRDQATLCATASLGVGSLRGLWLGPDHTLPEKGDNPPVDLMALTPELQILHLIAHPDYPEASDPAQRITPISRLLSAARGAGELDPAILADARPRDLKLLDGLLGHIAQRLRQHLEYRVRLDPE
jgi:hypothetical protein